MDKMMITSVTHIDKPLHSNYSKIVLITFQKLILPTGLSTLIMNKEFVQKLLK